MRSLLDIVFGLLILTAAPVSSQDSFNPLRGPYMGQKAGNQPVIFLPGKISTGANEGCSFFFPGARSFVWMTDLNGPESVLLLEDKQGRWQPPQNVTFLGSDVRVRDFSIAPGGDWIYLTSDQVTPGLAGDNIWRVRLESGKWREPAVLSRSVNSDVDDGCPTVTREGDLYFSRRDPHNPSESGLCFAAAWNGGFREAVRLDAPLNSPYQDCDPFIAADGSYLIFSSRRPGGFGDADLYICFSSGRGRWSDPVNLGPRINSSAQEGHPSVTLDGRYFFFTSNRKNIPELPPGVPPARSMPGNGGHDIYWMAADFTDQTPG